MAEKSAKRALCELDNGSRVVTYIEKDAFSFKWTIEDFSVMVQEKIISPVQVGGPINQLSWQVSITPKFRRDTGSLESYIQVSLEQVGSAKKNVKAELHLTMLNEHGKPSRLSKFRPSNDNSCRTMVANPPARRPEYGWDKIMSMSSVEKALKKDKLNLLCEISVLMGVKHIIEDSAISSRVPSPSI